MPQESFPYLEESHRNLPEALYRPLMRLIMVGTWKMKGALLVNVSDGCPREIHFVIKAEGPSTWPPPCSGPNAARPGPNEHSPARTGALRRGWVRHDEVIRKGHVHEPVRCCQHVTGLCQLIFSCYIKSSMHDCFLSILLTS